MAQIEIFYVNGAKTVAYNEKTKSETTNTLVECMASPNAVLVFRGSGSKSDTVVNKNLITMIEINE